MTIKHPKLQFLLNILDNGRNIGLTYFKISSMVVLWFFASMGVAHAQRNVDQELDRIIKEGYALIEKGLLDNAIETFQGGLKLSPENRYVAHDLACAYALKLEIDTAVDWHLKSLLWGFDNLEHIKTDDYLDNIRDDPRFKALNEGLKLSLLRRRIDTENLKMKREVTLQLITMIKCEFGLGAGIIFGQAEARFYICTAEHVVRQGKLEAQDIHVMFKDLPDRWVEARIEHFDKDIDLAVLSVEKDNVLDIKFCELPLDRLGSTQILTSGSPVFPAGYPNGEPWGMPLEADKFVKMSDTELEFQSNFVERGASGGGLLNNSGELVGMIKADKPPFGRAISINKIFELLRAWNYPVQLYYVGNDGETPLHKAASSGDSYKVKQLIIDCADVNAEDYNHKTPLHYAVLHGSLDAPSYLLDAGAKPNAWAAFESTENSYSYWKTPLHLAVEKGAVELVKILVGKGSNVNSYIFDILEPDAIFNKDTYNNDYYFWNPRWEKLENPLQIAANQGFVEIASILLMNGADVNGGEIHSGIPPLHQASKYNSVEFVNLLIKNKVNINAKWEDGWTALHFAARENAVNCVTVLIENGAEINSINEKGMTPLHLAARAKALECVKILIQSGVNTNAIDKSGETSLHLAAKNGDVSVIKALIAGSANVNIKSKEGGMFPLHNAIGSGISEAVKVLLSQGAKLDERNAYSRSPLEQAIEDGFPEITKILLDAGADPNEKSSSGRPVLHFAILREMEYYRDGKKVDWNRIQVENVNALLAAGANINEISSDGFTPLHTAISGGEVEIVKLLIDSGADLNVVEGEHKYRSMVTRNWTPLHLAASGKDQQIVKYLLKGGAQVEVRDARKRTPLHIAISEGNSEILKELIAGGADVNAMAYREYSSYQQSALHIAVTHNSPKSVEVLLKAGADFNVQDQRGNTPLHEVATTDNVEIAKLLISAGTNINIKNNETQTALDVAMRYQNKKVVNLLGGKSTQK